MVDVLFNGTPIRFQIDTGAEVTESISPQLKGANLQSSQRTLRGPSQNALPTTGQFMGTITYGNQVIQQEVYVINTLLKPLLGRPAIEALGLLSRIAAVETVDSSFQRFPRLFQGLGKMQGE